MCGRCLSELLPCAWESVPWRAQGAKPSTVDGQHHHRSDWTPHDHYLHSCATHRSRVKVPPRRWMASHRRVLRSRSPHTVLRLPAVRKGHAPRLRYRYRRTITVQRPRGRLPSAEPCRGGPAVVASRGGTCIRERFGAGSEGGNDPHPVAWPPERCRRTHSPAPCHRSGPRQSM